MDSYNPDRFVRLSNTLLESLLTFPLTGIELRIILWVLRNTDGWNRKRTRFRWRRIAERLGTARTVVCPAGRRLLDANILLLEDGQLGIQKDEAQWRPARRAAGGDVVRQLAMEGADCYLGATQASPPGNKSVTCGQRTRYQGVTHFRRAKDILKDILKTYI